MIHRKSAGVFILAVFVFPLWLASSPAEAGLLSVGDSVWGSNSVTRDTVSGLEWLDVHRSANRSFSEVSSEFGSGGDFMGWRYATTAEVTALFTGLGFSSNYISGPATGYMFDLIMMFGVTFQAGDSILHVDQTIGFFDDGGAFGPYGRASLTVADGTGGTSEETAFIREGISNGFESDFEGSWLVRNAPVSVSVPEPTTLILFVAGLMGLGFARGHRRTSA